MGNLSESANWDANVYQIESGDFASGGPSGIANKSSINLANRTKYLKACIDNVISSTGVTPNNDYHQLEAALESRIANSTVSHAASADAVPWSGVSNKPNTLAGYGIGAGSIGKVASLSVDQSVAGNAFVEILVGTYNCIQPAGTNVSLMVTVNMECPAALRLAGIKASNTSQLFYEELYYRGGADYSARFFSATVVMNVAVPSNGQINLYMRVKHLAGEGTGNLNTASSFGIKMYVQEMFV